MTEFRTVIVDDVFEAVNGRPKYIVDYIEGHSGEFPVYSASLTAPFGYVDDYDHANDRLTWIMNGYGGRMQVVAGPFSANRDRGVLVPKPEFEQLDMDYARHAIEPAFRVEAVGRRVDGLRNEYTKLYPPAAKKIGFELPVTDDGEWDWATMTKLGERLRAIDTANERLGRVRHDLTRAQLRLEIPEPYVEISLGDPVYFESTIGDRVLKAERIDGGEVPIYSANVKTPFGFTDTTKAEDFSKPSIIWGIDGIFDWNLVPAGQSFEHTDHCGRLQLRSSDLDAEYVLLVLQATRGQYGFDRVYRASLGNLRSNVTVRVPLDSTGNLSLDRQKEIASAHRSLLHAQTLSLEALDTVVSARVRASSV